MAEKKKKPRIPQPVRCMALVKPDQVEKKTQGGIIIPDVAVERKQYAVESGTIVAVGGNFFDKGRKGTSDGRIPKVGDRVLFDKYQGRIFEVDEIEYRLINDDDIGMILPEAE